MGSSDHKCLETVLIGNDPQSRHERWLWSSWQALLLGVRGEWSVSFGGSGKYFCWQVATFWFPLWIRAVRRVMQVVAWWICHQRKRGTQAVNVYQCIRIPAHPWFNSFLNQKLSPVFLSFPLLFLLINVFLSLSPTPQVNGFWFSRSLIIYKLLSYAFRINIKSLKNIHNSHSTLILGIIIRK